MSFSSSEHTDKLDAALARVLAAVEPAVKDKVNPAFRSTYADLGAVWEAARPALASEGVSVTQWPLHSDDGRLHLLTRLALAGQWMAGESSIPVAKADPQGYGSAMTYIKRYALAAVLGVVADEDDDGNAASRPARQQPKAPPKVPEAASTPPPDGRPATAKQLELIGKMMKSHVITAGERDKLNARIEAGMTSKQATDAIDWLKTETQARKAVEREEAAA